MQNKHIAIIIPRHNGKNVISECLASLHNQIDSAFEIIIVDNASTDNGIEDLQSKYKNIYIIKNVTNVGYGIACNQGIALAKTHNASAVIILNQDTIVEKNFFIEARKIIADKTVGLASPTITYGFTSRIWWAGSMLYRGLSLLTYPSFRISRHVRKGELLSTLPYKETDTESITGCVMLIRMDVLDEVGGFDPKFFMYAEDLDLSIRVKNHGYTLKYFSSTSVHHMVTVGRKKPLTQKIKKAIDYFTSTAKFVFKHYTIWEQLVWIIKLPIVLPLEYKNLRKME